MDDDLVIKIVGSGALHDATRKELARIVEQRGQALIDEAGRLEAASNPGGASSIITPAMVQHANTGQLLGLFRPKMSRSSRYFLLSSTMTTFIGGIFINNIDKIWGAVGALFCGIAAVILFIRGTE